MRLITTQPLLTNFELQQWDEDEHTDLLVATGLAAWGGADVCCRTRKEDAAAWRWFEAVVGRASLPLQEGAFVTAPLLEWHIRGAAIGPAVGVTGIETPLLQAFAFAEFPPKADVIDRARRKEAMREAIEELLRDNPRGVVHSLAQSLLESGSGDAPRSPIVRALARIEVALRAQEDGETVVQRLALRAPEDELRRFEARAGMPIPWDLRDLWCTWNGEEEHIGLFFGEALLSVAWAENVLEDGRRHGWKQSWIPVVGSREDAIVLEGEAGVFRVTWDRPPEKCYPSLLDLLHAIAAALEDGSLFWDPGDSTLVES